MKRHGKPTMGTYAARCAPASPHDYDLRCTPPSTGRLTPVMIRPAGEQRKATWPGFGFGFGFGFGLGSGFRFGFGFGFGFALGVGSG